MINAGAITVHSMICGEDADEPERTAAVLEGFSAMAGRQLHVNEDVFESEIDVSYRNLAIANMLRARGPLTDDPYDVVRGYVKQCAVAVTPRDLAMMAATLANGGVQPITGERVIPAAVVRQVLSAMTTCGMYDSAGEWVSHVGIPAKSGVSGGIFGALPASWGSRHTPHAWTSTATACAGSPRSSACPPTWACT